MNTLQEFLGALYKINKAILSEMVLHVVGILETVAKNFDVACKCKKEVLEVVGSDRI